MKVLVIQKPGELKFIECEKPIPGPNEILAKVAHCGICATDISILKGNLKLGKNMDPIYPVRIGHEWSGVIVEVGSATRRLKVGDPVISDTGYSCGECKYCLEGEYQCCENGRAIGTIGDCWPGAFADYMLMPERLTYRVPSNISLDEAALIEPASIGLYGLLKAGIGPGKNLLVYGTGSIGMCALACAKGMGIGKTILVGRKEKKLAIGSEIRADILVNTTNEKVKDVVARETAGCGMDIILDTTGSKEIFNDVLDLVRPSGMIVNPGFYNGEIPNANMNALITKNCTLIGAAGTPNMGRKILDLLSFGHTSLKPLITHRFHFSQAKEAFETMLKDNDSRIKIMIDF